ncbi:MAG: hypothetical protein FJW35_04285 [Acidobacteria bacterium]|nr:hypothetical protein [Acidobacteriota bacterium]
MKSMHIVKTPLLVVLLTAFVPPVVAQDLTFFAGGTSPGDLESNIGRIRLENGPIWGFRFSMGFASVLGFEHTIAFSPDYLFPKNQPGVDDANGFIYSSSLIVQIPAGRVMPYGTFGLGLIWQHGSPNLPVGLEFAINYGGGVKLARLWGPVGLRLDARGYTVPKVLSTKLNMFELSGGVLVSF